MTTDDVLTFWFGDDPNQYRDSWFKHDAAFDAAIQQKFGSTLASARDGALDNWATTPAGALALVIVLDQFSRNLHRGSGLAFAGDAHARRIARNAVATGADMHLTPMQRIFLYLPFEHAEDLGEQDRSVALFETLPIDDFISRVQRSAREHREVIRRFGRFPRRNAALSRADTPEELAYMGETNRSY